MKNNKLGHRAPKGYITNDFNSIKINGNLAFCKSHNFVYDAEVENKKLYNGEVCYYTDKRYADTAHNYFMNCMLHWTRWKSISLKSCIRKTLKCRNIPVGTIVEFNKSWTYRGKKIDNSYAFKVRKENKFDPQYEVSLPQYSAQFTDCQRSIDLTNALRANGFLVKVENNKSFLRMLMNTASALSGGRYTDEGIGGETAIAYGHGKIIGFSSYNNTFMGYSAGHDSILWDKFGEFCKWSKCEELSKDSSIEDIVSTLNS